MKCETGMTLKKTTCFNKMLPGSFVNYKILQLLFIGICKNDFSFIK